MFVSVNIPTNIAMLLRILQCTVEGKGTPGLTVTMSIKIYCLEMLQKSLFFTERIVFSVN